MHQVNREQAWNETEFVLFYQAHASFLLDYLSMQTRTLEDAEDILVETFMAARQLPHLVHEQSRGQFAWLRQVARNKMVDYYRLQEQSHLFSLEKAWRLTDQEISINPEQAMVRTETLQHLQAAIQRLPAPQQELLRLRFAEGLRCPQIATHMGKRAGAVRTMLVRTLKTLRAIYSTNQEGNNEKAIY